MTNQTDQQLLRDYSDQRSEAAFSELVRRHVDLVHSAAMRMVRDAHLAEDVTQGTFVALARNASQLRHRPVLSGWLHRTAQNLAANIVRADVRRRAREHEAATMNQLLSAEGDATWEQIAPHLDAALVELDETARDALMLRYFERKSAHEIGRILSVSNEAAQKRVSRAVEHLRECLARRGVATGASGLLAVLSLNVVQAAPAGLAVTVSAFVVSASAGLATAATISTQTAITTMNFINAKAAIAIVVSALVAGTGTHLWQQRELTRLAGLNQELMAKGEELIKERDAALAMTSSNTSELANLRRNQSELLRLRGEVGQLRRHLESQTNRSRPQPAPAGNAQTAKAAPGAYLTKEQLAHVGYATPEDALQTITWAMMNGTYEQVSEGLSPEMLASELKDPKNREGFEARQKVMAPLFKGFQIVARKLLSDDRVEIKIKMDAEPIPGQQREQPAFLVQPMIKVDDAWKLGGSTREHRDAWDTEGEIHTFVPK